MYQIRPNWIARSGTRNSSDTRGWRTCEGNDSRESISRMNGSQRIFPSVQWSARATTDGVIKDGRSGHFESHKMIKLTTHISPMEDNPDKAATAAAPRSRLQKLDIARYQVSRPMLNMNPLSTENTRGNQIRMPGTTASIVPRDVAMKRVTSATAVSPEQKI